MYYVNVFVFVWCPCMAINVSVQHNGGFLLTPCYYHRGTRLNAMKRFYFCSLCSHLNVLTFFPLWLRDAQKVYMCSDFYFKTVVAYPRPALPATKRTSYAPNVKRRENIVPWPMAVETLSWSCLALEPASSGPKPCSSLETHTSNLARPSLLVGSRRKNTNYGQRSASPLKQFAPWILAHKGSALPWLVDTFARAAVPHA